MIDGKYITLYSYKEPLMPFKGGFGYEGVLLLDPKIDKVQCHLCGLWFDYLPYHVRKEHGLSAALYRERTGLMRTTSLINEAYREKIIKRSEGNIEQMSEIRKKIIYDDDWKRKQQEGTKLGKNTREFQNRRGTCPAQLLERLRADAKRLGRSPKAREINYREALYKTYGTLNNALIQAGLAVTPVGRYTSLRSGRARKYEDAYLLEIFTDFYERNNRMPTISDFRRRLMPVSSMTYCSHFGSLEKARVAALKKVKSS